LHQVNQKLPQEAVCPVEWAAWVACPEWAAWVACPEWIWIKFFRSIFFFLIIDAYFG
jgi:hypothetical protein